jgi:hypothetical protein
MKYEPHEHDVTFSIEDIKLVMKATHGHNCKGNVLHHLSVGQHPGVRLGGKIAKRNDRSEPSKLRYPWINTGQQVSDYKIGR